MPECMKHLAHSLTQTGPSMRKRAAENPEPLRDLPTIYDFGCGQKQRTNDKGNVADIAIRGAGSDPAPNQRLRELRAKQRKQPWRIHQSTANKTKGSCCWGKCPGLKKIQLAGAKRSRAYL